MCEMTFQTHDVEFPELPQQGNDTEWEYNMRREMQEIIPGLYLGPYSVATRRKLEYLKEHCITHIICIRHPVEANRIKPNFPGIFQYLILDIIDSPTENIIQHLPKVKAFIDQCLTCEGRILVHGSVGMSRSAAIVIAYLMESFGLCYKDAHGYVQERRFCVNPNEGFVQQLQEYEPIYLARRQMERCPTEAIIPSSSCGLKRNLEEDDDSGHDPFSTR